MTTPRIVTILVVCTIYVLLMPPIERMINKRLQKRWAIRTLTFIIGLAILFGLYALSDLLGFWN